ncbi:MAG: cystathionine gamma-synthase [Bacteroidetes Order II. Incertae sedis bacterium]|nr:cystathionine gamma-synthase [Bacteroidetes Order II. bacterium]MBT4602982.1 cystathionine gamma-synthase [Bacteroidetes Order II. bacterium]MBT5249715.1 cystathionine gamma-synthase [Bacteroidetes Order II. bacterium]MBT6201685.1 cystathionine gamma-synthase [Bacteroidetes Order II. bacterium]MBT6424789.1 cystathionine gamma-synthase [Bacteroidetes Order II. bacterium]
MGLGTKSVHAGQEPDPSTGAVMTPVYQTSTYAQAAPGDHKGHEYGRVTNPTRTALEGNLAALESAQHGICFSSGVAATDAIVKCLRPGDHIVASNDLYGGTYRLIRQVFGPFDISSDFVDMTDLDVVRNAIKPETKLLWIETPTNPLVRVVDISALSKLAHEYDVVAVVDNTFASPILQRPLEQGADLVVHSTTKYLGGHSDVIGGAICTNDDEWNEKLRFLIKSAGAVPGPMDCFLTLRGTKTLQVRMERHCSNAQAIAEFLSAHEKVDKVYYPGLPDFEGYELASRQMDGFGGMVSFLLKDDSMEAATQVLSSTQVFTLAESLGGVESLMNHPATMTHASIPANERLAAGLHDSLIRLSVGIEDVNDLIADLDRTLAEL